MLKNRCIKGAISSESAGVELQPADQPCYVISVAARKVGLRAQTLRYYERLGLVGPCRTKGKIRLYSDKEIERLKRIKTLVTELGVNLAGANVILRLIDRVATADQAMQQLLREMEVAHHSKSAGSQKTRLVAEGEVVSRQP